MFFSYFKTALRQIRIYKTYALINIAGLSIGLAASFIVFLYVSYQTSYDRHNKNLKDLYVITSESLSAGWTEPLTPVDLAPTLKNEFPEVEEAARWVPGGLVLKSKDTVFQPTRGAFSDMEIFKILTLPLKYGSAEILKTEQDSIVINETMAETYFKGKNPLGEVVSTEIGGVVHNFKIAAVMRDVPKTATWRANLVIPFSVAERFFAPPAGVKGNPIPSWDFNAVVTYVRLRPGADRAAFGKKLAELSRLRVSAGFRRVFHPFPVGDLYFHSAAMMNNRFPAGDLANVYIYSAAAFLLLFIACVNYLMLNLGRASLRTKEVGVRKVVGATKSDLFKQIITEAIVVALLALPVALAITQSFLPYLTQIMGVKITSDYLQNIPYLLLFLAVTALTGIIAGSYISVYLSGLNPIDILKNKMGAGAGRPVFRNILMGTQMVIFLGLILMSLVINKQLRYFLNRDPGFDKDRLVLLYPNVADFGAGFEALKNELKSHPGILGVSGAQDLPGTEDKGAFSVPRKDNPLQSVTIEGLACDADFIETMGMTVVQGASLAGSGGEGPGAGCVLNETAVRELGLKNPIGEMVNDRRVVGVVRDFNMHSLHERIGSQMIWVGVKYIQEVVVKIRPENRAATIAFIREASKRFNDGRPMQTAFYEERLDALYGDEHKFAIVIGYATGLAVFVACLGIFGISFFVCQQRIKEIGIRKVLGASVRSVYAMIAKEFIVLILASSAVAFPLAYYSVRGWLRNYAYRTEVGFWIFPLAALLGVIVVTGTVSVRAIKAARTNPAKSIKYE